MADTNINTLLGSVTWEMIEPEEDKFDFSVIDQIISDARKHSMHLVLLWFGSFKNGKPRLSQREEIQTAQPQDDRIIHIHTSLGEDRQHPVPPGETSQSGRSPRNGRRALHLQPREPQSRRQSLRPPNGACERD